MVARSPVSQSPQLAGFLRMAALTSAAQRSNPVWISPSTGTGAEICQHLMAVVGRAVLETHEQRRAGQLGESHRPWEQPGLAAEEGNLDGAGPVALMIGGASIAIVTTSLARSAAAASTATWGRPGHGSIFGRCR